MERRVLTGELVDPDPEPCPPSSEALDDSWLEWDLEPDDSALCPPDSDPRPDRSDAGPDHSSMGLDHDDLESPGSSWSAPADGPPPEAMTRRFAGR